MAAKTAESKRRPGITKSPPSSKRVGDSEMMKKATQVVTDFAKFGVKVATPATMAQLISLEQRLSAMKAKKSKPMPKPMPKPMAKPATGGTVALKKGGYVTKKGNFTKKGPCK